MIFLLFRPVMPVLGSRTSVAVAFLNKWTAGTPLKVSLKLTSANGLDNPGGYRATDVIQGKDLGLYKPGDTFNASVNPTGKWIIQSKFSMLSPE